MSEKKEKIPRVKIFLSGILPKNPGRGGYGLIIVTDEGQAEYSQAYEYTTSNRIELLAAIAGLEKLKTRSYVELYSQADYLVNIDKYKWYNNYCYGSNKKRPNEDLWRKLGELLKKHEVRTIHTRSKYSMTYDRQCDELAVEAIDHKKAIEDKGA